MMLLYIFIICLVILLIVRFLYLGRNRDHFNVAVTNFGNKNHDPLIIQRGKECLIIVTDPVGATRTGESACLIAKEVITNAFETSIAKLSPHEFLKKACFLAHRGISEQMNANSGGCSIALVYIDEKQLSFASVGDIKIFVCDGELQQLNQLDLYKYQLRTRVLERKISEEHLLNNRLRNELTAYLGHENLRKVNLNDQGIELEKRDKLLIATRDIYDVLMPLEIESIMLGEKKPIRHIEVLEGAYALQRQVVEKKSSTASAVVVSCFK